MTTFSWKTSTGAIVEVEPISDVDEWSGREMRVAEKLCGGILDGAGHYTIASLMFAIAIARTVPGYTVESADSELSLGRVRGILDELRQHDQAAAATAAVAALPDGDPEPEVGDVPLSPTRLGEPDDTPPPA